MKLLMVPLMCLLIQAPAPTPAFTYRFQEVHHGVNRWPGGDARRAVKAATGDPAYAGDEVKTGWWGRATLAVPERATRFEIFSRTQVRLASGEPGVLMVLEQGRLKAIFDALVGGPPVERRVKVPGALLAVRGTRYGVEVGSGGRTTLAVFKGVVEVISQAPQAPSTFVKAGEWSAFGPGQTPRVAPMRDPGAAERGWDQGMRPGMAMGLESMGPGGAMPAQHHGSMPGPMR